MNPLAVTKAKSRLYNANSALNALLECTTFDEFVRAWYTFLFSSNGIYTVLEKGSKESAQSLQWFGRKKSQRRQDPLLQYLKQARDDDEHGIGNVVLQDKTHVRFQVNIDGVPMFLNIKALYKPGESGEIDIDTFGNQEVTPEMKRPYVRLLPVHDRSGKIYPPPKAHLGQSIDKADQPLTIGFLAIKYFNNLVQESSLL